MDLVRSNKIQLIHWIYHLLESFSDSFNLTLPLDPVRSNKILSVPWIHMATPSGFRFGLSLGITVDKFSWYMILPHTVKSSHSYSHTNNMVGNHPYERYWSMKVPQLRKIWADRGISHHGKRHAELVELAGEAVKTYDAIEDCDHDNSERRRRLATDAGGTVVNLYGKQVVWMHDLRGLPSLVIVLR